MPTAGPASVWPRLGGWFLALFLLATPAALLPAEPPAPRAFDLPADTLARSIKAFAKQSGSEVLVGGGLDHKLRTRPVQGHLTPQEAIEAMLADTGWAAFFDPKTGVFAISRRLAAPIDPGLARIGGATPIAAPGSGRPNAAGAANADENPVVLDLFVVSGERDVGYRSNQTVSGSRTLEELRDVANTISVYNRDLMDDLQASSGDELSRFFVTGERSPAPQADETFVFRGIPNSWQLHDGIIWYPPVDTFNIERVEVLRGPNAFLYGEAGPTGSINHLTKRATGTREIQRLRVTGGSHDFRRAELDVNRRLGGRLAVRANLVGQESGSFIDYVGRRFKAAALAVHARPFARTTIDASFELGRSDENRALGLYNERFSTTLRDGTTATLASADGGRTLIPALGQVYNLAGTRVSTGNYVLLPDESIAPRSLNLIGPDGRLDGRYRGANFSVQQRVGEHLALQLTLAWQDDKQWRDTCAGTGANAIYLDRNAKLPDGTPNPYFNEYYTEYYRQRRYRAHLVRDARLAAVYDLHLPFTTQRLIATAMQHQDNPNQSFWSEFVDPFTPGSGFSGTLLNANTLAASNTNISTLNRNFFYRRFYFKDGDASALTHWAPVPGRSVLLYDPVISGTAGRTVDRRFYTPSYGFGSSGSYCGGRLRSMLGWRHDRFDSRVDRAFANPVSGDQFRLPERPRETTVVDVSAWNCGGVLHLTRFLSASCNWAQTYSLTTGEGNDGYKLGTKQGLPIGDGCETGLRWSLLGGRLESNWTYYVTHIRRDRGVPTPATVVRTELSALFADFNSGTSGRDTQALASSGVECETVANVTKNWKLIANVATNRVRTGHTMPQLRAYQARAADANLPTPQLDQFLATIVDGTPVRGYTKTRINLVTNYRFGRSNPLRGFFLGGGVQARGRTFLGNLGAGPNAPVAEKWAPAWTVWNFTVGYESRVLDHALRGTLGILNLFDRTYYRASSLNDGSWGAGRSLRCSITLEL